VTYTAASDPGSTADVYTVPYANGAGGAAKPVAGASDPSKQEYYPVFSPDDAWLAFVSIPNGEHVRSGGSRSLRHPGRAVGRRRGSRRTTLRHAPPGRAPGSRTAGPSGTGRSPGEREHLLLARLQLDAIPGWSTAALITGVVVTGTKWRLTGRSIYGTNRPRRVTNARLGHVQGAAGHGGPEVSPADAR